jgi:hypothetical protein
MVWGLKRANAADGHADFMNRDADTDCRLLCQFGVIGRRGTATDSTFARAPAPTEAFLGLVDENGQSSWINAADEEIVS